MMHSYITRISQLVAVLTLLPYTALCGKNSGVFLNKEAFLEENIDKTTTTLASQMRVFCATDGIDVSFLRENILGLGVIMPGQLQLSSSACISTANETHFTLRTNFLDCGTQIELTPDKTSATIKNKVIVTPPTMLLTDDEDSLGAAGESSMPVEIAFTCTYSEKSAETTTLSSSTVSNTDDITSATIELYSTDSYSSEVDLRLDITRGTSLYVKVKGFSATGSATNFQIDSCYLSSRRGSDVTQDTYYLIKDGCEVDRDAQFKEDTIDSPRKFLFRARRLYGNRKMYLHCALVSCYGSGDNQCKTQERYCNRATKVQATSVLHTSLDGTISVIKRIQNNVAVTSKPSPHTTQPITTRQPLNTVQPNPQRQCPTIKPSTLCICSAPAAADVIKSTESFAGMVSIELTVVVAVLSFVIGAAFIAIIWCVYIRTDPSSKRQAVSDDGLSSQESTVPTEKLMKHSNDITSSDESN